MRGPVLTDTSLDDGRATTSIPPQAQPEGPLAGFTPMYPLQADASDIFEKYSPEELVDKALKRLQDAGIELIEWASLLWRRMNVPVLITNFSYLVPDDQLDAASTLLAQGEGLPRSQPPPFLLKTGGDLFAKAHMHRLSRHTSLALAQHLNLYPSSLSRLARADLSPAPRTTSLAAPQCRTVLVPARPAVYASLIRIIRAYPACDPLACVVKSDLSQLVGYDLYGLAGGYVDTDDEALCQELEVDRRVEDAVRLVEGWCRTGVLRDGDGDEEGWVGDALVRVVAGTLEIEDLPCKPRGS